MDERPAPESVLFQEVVLYNQWSKTKALSYPPDVPDWAFSPDTLRTYSGYTFHGCTPSGSQSIWRRSVVATKDAP